MRRPTKPKKPDDFVEIVALIDAARSVGSREGSTSSAVANSDNAQLEAFETAAAAELSLPVAAHVIGESVRITKIHYAGHPRAGLTATCTRADRAHDIHFADVVFPAGSVGASLVARYRAWLGAGDDGAPLEVGRATGRAHKVTSAEITLGSPIELIVLACKSNALRCRVLGTASEVTLRTAVRDEVPAGIIRVIPTKQWTRARHAYLAGNVLSMRADVEALGLVPLALHDQGEWDPAKQYWGEEGEPIPEWAVSIIACGKRPMFELEQVIPGADPDDFDSDPIGEASELNAAGDHAGARELLMSLLAQDLRCLDAHAHLGNFSFEQRPAHALRHYEMGLSLGALSLGKTFSGVLAWGLIDNRPFLRCLHGLGLCWWRLAKTREAAAVFRKMLWLNPGDNQGVRFNLAALEAGKTWEEMEDAEQ